MSRYRLTPKMIAVDYADYRSPASDGGDFSGPATVYYSRADVARAAKHFGWGAVASPLAVVRHMGDNVPLIEVLIGSLVPSRIVR